MLEDFSPTTILICTGGKKGEKLDLNFSHNSHLSHPCFESEQNIENLKHASEMPLTILFSENLGQVYPLNSEVTNLEWGTLKTQNFLIRQ